MVKAIALISGGLDSIVAAKVVKDMGIEVTGLYFKTPFCLRKKKDNVTPTELAATLARDAGIPLVIRELGDDFLAMVRHPKYGYGKNINPCIDCKILMLRKAKEFMEQRGACFLISGEVVAQRPMSQHRPALSKIIQEAQVEGILLRPLSAKLLAPTIAEEKGWVDRTKLFDFNGRSRTPQMELAVMLGIIDFPNASGGCLLTDPRYTARLKDLFKFGPYDLPNVELLKFGRHYRFSPQAKLIIGREETDNASIEELGLPGDYLFIPALDFAGPSALARGAFTDEMVKLSAGIIARYCDAGGKPTVGITYVKLPDKATHTLTVAAIPDAESEKYRL